MKYWKMIIMLTIALLSAMISDLNAKKTVTVTSSTETQKSAKQDKVGSANESKTFVVDGGNLLALNKLSNLSADLEDLDDLEDVDFDVSSDEDSNKGAFFGIVPQNLTLSKAQELGYNKFYGILVASVVPNAPASRAGVMADDIIMTVNGKEIKSQAFFSKLIDGLSVGDTISVVLFSNGKEKTLPVVLGARGENKTKTKITVSTNRESKTSHSVGYGGGTWMPIWYNLNLDDVNHVLNINGFQKLDNDYIFMNGGGGKGHIGKGLFIGGMGAGFVDRKSTRVDSTIFSSTYKVSFGGVTLDKRIAISENWIGSLGFMLGGGKQSIEMKQYSKTYSPTGYDWGSLDDEMVLLNEHKIRLKRNYIVFQPKAEVLYRVTSWLGFRAEAGYMLGYSKNKGWKVANDSNATVKNSPDTKLDGLTFSIGPWFGF